MKRLLFILAVIACAHKESATSGRERDVYPPIPADLQAKVRLSEEFGRALYAQDKAAEIATDVLFANVPRDTHDETMAGYLTTGDPKSWMVSFYTRDEPPRVKYRVRLPEHGRPVFEKLDPPQPASDFLQLLIRMRAAAIEAAGPFKQPMNPAILPAGRLGSADGDWLVELLAGTTERDAVVLGQHFRVICSKDGAVKSVMPLSNKPLLIRRERGKVPEAMYVSEVVADYPLEIHVLASLQANLPLDVINERGVWGVYGDEIKFLGKPKQ
jgi:hypothetical protein